MEKTPVSNSSGTTLDRGIWPRRLWRWRISGAESFRSESMTRTELLEILRNGENSGVEFKRDDIGPRDLAKEVVALANLRGGIIQIGIHDAHRTSRNP